MIQRLLAFLKVEEIELKEELSVPLAIGVLYYEIMRADDIINPKEVEAFEQLISEEFGVDGHALQDVLQKVEQEAKDSVDYMQFTRVIHENCTLVEKKKIVSMLWHLAAADGHIDPHEEHLIRKMSDLMYLSHSDFIQAKLSVFPQ